MRITTWAEYGLICALNLAKRAGEGPITGREIASSERLPGDYVEQILLRLRRAGLVNSTRGARGGYMLARAADEISVREVIAASELAPGWVGIAVVLIALGLLLESFGRDALWLIRRRRT